jgi:hypothetical protein
MVEDSFMVLAVHPSQKGESKKKKGRGVMTFYTIEYLATGLGVSANKLLDLFVFDEENRKLLCPRYEGGHWRIPLFRFRQFCFDYPREICRLMDLPEAKLDNCAWVITLMFSLKG